MGDVVQIRDYQSKKGTAAPRKSDEGPATIYIGWSSDGIDGLAWPGMGEQAPYVAPEEDPA